MNTNKSIEPSQRPTRSTTSCSTRLWERRALTWKPSLA